MLTHFQGPRGLVLLQPSDEIELPFDTRKPEKLHIFISHDIPQPSRIAVFVLDMNGAAGSS